MGSQCMHICLIHRKCSTLKLVSLVTCFCTDSGKDARFGYYCSFWGILQLRQELLLEQDNLLELGASNPKLVGSGWSSRRILYIASFFCKVLISDLGFIASTCPLKCGVFLEPNLEGLYWMVWSTRDQNKSVCMAGFFGESEHV